MDTDSIRRALRSGSLLLLFCLFLGLGVVACGASGSAAPDGSGVIPNGGNDSGGGGSGGTGTNDTNGDERDAATSSSSGGTDALDASAPIGSGASGAGGAETAGAGNAGGSANAAGAGGGGATTPGVDVIGSFAPGGSTCGLGYDALTDAVWLYPCSGAELLGYLADGTPLGAVPVPGESANDVDVDFVSADVQLANVDVPEGSLYFINGETGAAEIYALDPEDGALLATLVTAHGASHVVGGAYHVGRGTYFTVQDRVPGAELGNEVAELDAETGAILNQFSTLPAFDVNYGDLDVCQSTGNLFVVSSIESVIAELSPTGALVAEHPLPAEVASLAGIGIDDLTGEVWVTSNAGGVWHLNGLPCDGI